MLSFGLSSICESVSVLRFERGDFCECVLEGGMDVGVDENSVAGVAGTDWGGEDGTVVEDECVEEGVLGMLL